MPKLATPPGDIQPRTAWAKPKAKPYKLTDGGGLYLLVNADGAKYWRMDYRLADLRQTLAFGKYPQVSLAEARDKRKQRDLFNRCRLGQSWWPNWLFIYGFGNLITPVACNCPVAGTVEMFSLPCSSPRPIAPLKTPVPPMMTNAA